MSRTRRQREPVQEALRSYMSAYAPFYDAQGEFVGVVGIDMWVRDFDERLARIRRAGMTAFAAVTLLSLLAGYVMFRLSRHGAARAAARPHHQARARTCEVASRSAG